MVAPIMCSRVSGEASAAEVPTLRAVLQQLNICNANPEIWKRGMTRPRALRYGLPPFDKGWRVIKAYLFGDFQEYKMNKTTIRCLAIAGTGVLFSCGNKSGSEGDETKLGDVAVEGRACAEGETPLRDGCTLPCTDGWHEGPDGGCVVDCPPMMTEQEDGSCALSCGEGEEAEEDTLLAEVGTLHLKFCNRGCPEGMELIDGRCELPCGDGWTRNKDGECHLSCPEGMVETDDDIGCALQTVGENKVCPDGNWDTSIEGPSPLFVDPEEGSADGDGTEEAPFTTINQAVAAMGDTATIYLAPGEYDEQVIVDGKKAFNLIGQCAENVLIAPDTIVAPYPEGAEGRGAGVITAWRVDNVRIHGVKVRAQQGSAIVVRHDLQPIGSRAVGVDQVVVVNAALAAVVVRGAFNDVGVTNATLTRSLLGIDVATQYSEDESSGAILPAGSSGTVHILGNRIESLGSDDSVSQVVGVSVFGADQVTVTGNELSDLSYATGMDLWVVNKLIVEGNIMSDISGFGGMHLVGPDKESPSMDATIEKNVIFNINAAPCAYPNCPDYAEGIYFNAELGGFRVTLDRNRFERVQGDAVAIAPDDETGANFNVSACEFIKSYEGISWGSGNLDIDDCRFSHMWVAIYGGAPDQYQPIGNLDLRRSVFENRELDPSGILEDSEEKERPGVVYLTDRIPQSTTRVIGNLFRNNKMFDIDRDLYVLRLSGGDLRVEDNVFSNNDGTATDVDSGSLSVENNRYLNNDTGIVVIQSPGTRVDASDIRGNVFVSNVNGLFEIWSEETGDYSVEDNVFLQTAAYVGDLDPTGQSAERLRVDGNYFGATFVQTGNAAELAVNGNLFQSSRLTVVSQPEGGEGRISGNRLERSHLEVYQAASAVRIENNEITGPSSFPYPLYLGAGIGVFESQGPVEIVHNLINNNDERELPGIGIAGDGIQVIGSDKRTPDLLWMEANRIESNERFGALVVGVEGYIDGNMYRDNGNGGDDHLVLSLPRGEGYDGSDVAFATEKRSPPAVAESETILSGL